MADLTPPGSSEILILYTAPPESAAEAAELFPAGFEIRPAVSGACSACGFLSLTGLDGHVVVDHCVCAIRQTHVPTCLLRQSRESKIDIGCGCTNESMDCPTCWPCTCTSETA